MDFVNSTAIPALITTGKFPGTDSRIGILVAKATFTFAGGVPVLDTQNPLPIQHEDRVTDLGVLPADFVPRRDAAFEVVLLGAAYSPLADGSERETVRLSIGSHKRAIEVIGDREWIGTGKDAHISKPARFTRMPLTYANAFGGTCSVEIDRESFLDVSDPRNASGRGFDPTLSIEGLKTSIGMPPGFPVYDQKRRLPNLERAETLIRAWDDAPDPVSWEAVPLQSSIQARRSLNVEESDTAKIAMPHFKEAMLHRAHPDWVIDLPPPRARITMEGVASAGEVLSFQLPALRVLFDYVSGERSGMRELTPHMLILLPEEQRLCLIFRHPFSYEYPSAERSVRLRTEDGWHSPPAT